MINTIIFSKDRAAQLDLLLCSIERYAQWLWPPTVLYRYSNNDYLEGYRLVSTRHGITFTWQLPLKPMLLRAIDRMVPLTMMLVDDSVFFRKFSEFHGLDEGTTFAARLGRNCTYCYPLDKQQRVGELDFAYSLTIDGHVYRTSEIRKRIEAVDFATPNELEDKLSRGKQLCVEYGDHSCIVSIPHNRVAEFDNRYEGGSAEELNRRFLAGECLDLDAMDFSNVIGAHQAIPYVWRPQCFVSSR